MTFVRNVLAIVVGLALGGAINMLILIYGSQLIPAPAGVDIGDPQSLQAGMHLFEPKHFISPFLAHAIGTLVGALTAFLIAASHRTIFAYLVGAAFLAGGIANAFMLPAPTWFIVADLLLAYLPMAWLAVSFGKRVSS